MPCHSSRVDGFAQDESGTTTPEFGILLVVVITTALSIGMLLRDTVRDNLTVSALTSQQTHHPHTAQQTVAPQSHTRFNLQVPSRLQRTFRWALIAVQAALAIALIVMVARRRRSKPKSSKPAIRTRESLDEQLKNILLALRHQSQTAQTLEPLIGQIMSGNVAIVSPSVATEEAMRQLLESKHEAMFVVGQDDALVGQITRLSLGTGGSAQRAMTSIPIKLEKSTRVSIALRKMLEEGCSTAPVLEHGRLCGVVSTIDITLALMAMIQLFKETQLRHREVMREACGANTSWDSFSGQSD